MNKLIVYVVVALIALSAAGHLVWRHVTYMDYLNEVVHETERWAVIEDINGDHLAVEPTSDETWNQLVNLHQNATRKWIGGISEEYSSKWGFRFKPEKITVAQVTAEGLQATIQFISRDLDYWLDLGRVYVAAEVTEIHGQI